MCVLCLQNPTKGRISFHLNSLKVPTTIKMEM